MQLTLTILHVEPTDPGDAPMLCYGYAIEASGNDFHLSRHFKTPVPPDLALRVALNLSDKVGAAVGEADDALRAVPATEADTTSTRADGPPPLSPALAAEIAAAEAAAKLGEV